MSNVTKVVTVITPDKHVPIVQNVGMHLFMKGNISPAVSINVVRDVIGDTIAMVKHPRIVSLTRDPILVLASVVVVSVKDVLTNVTTD